MFINLSNHPSQLWNKKQREAALQFGQIVDLPFPSISPYANGNDIDVLVMKYFDIIKQYDHPIVMLQGEFVFTYRLVLKLKENLITVVASCSERKVKEYVVNCRTKKVVDFEFVGFREY